MAAKKPGGGKSGKKTYRKTPSNPKQEKATENRKKNTKAVPSSTTKKFSNTNTVKPGKKGAYGAMGIVLPPGGKGKKRKSKVSNPEMAKGNPKEKPNTGTTTPPAKKEKKPKKPMTGNPGNDKPVGRAGEKEDKGMWPGGGVRGKGDNKDKNKGGGGGNKKKSTTNRRSKYR